MLMRTSALTTRKDSPALQHSLNHIAPCPACDAEKAEILRTTDLKDLKFSDAAVVCLEDEIKFTAIAAQTHEDHETFTKRLNKFFGELLLKDIHPGHIRSYQKERAQTAGAELINHEVSWLSHVLDKAGLWKELKPHVNRLKVEKSKRGIALTQEQRECVLVCAASNPRWWVAYLCTLLLANVPSGCGEIRKVKVGDVDLKNKVFRIDEGAKNNYRNRRIPMTETIFWIFSQLTDRYLKICERQNETPAPGHYILPFLQTAARRGKTVVAQGMQSYDLNRPMAGYRRAWDSLREKAGVPNMRIYDWRHTKATEFMEDPETSDHTIEELMGQGTKAMKEQYRHIRDSAKLDALERHEVRPVPKVVATAYGLAEVSPLEPKRPRSEKASLPGLLKGNK